MLTPNAKSDDRIPLYHHTGANDQNILLSFNQLSQYIGKVSDSIILLSDKGCNCLQFNASFKIFNNSFPPFLLPNLDGIILEIPDIRQDSRLTGGPVFPECPSLRFVAVVPLINSGYEVLGYLILRDDKPCLLDSGQKAALVTLANQLVNYLESLRIGSAKPSNNEPGQPWLDIFPDHETLAIAVEKSTTGVFVLNKEGKLAWANQALQSLLKYQQPDIEGLELNDLLILLTGKNTSLKFLEKLKSAFFISKPYQAELTLYTKHKTQIWVTLQITPIFDTPGNLERTVFTIADRTELKQVEDDLKKLSRVTSKSVNAIVFRGLDGRVNWVNPAFERIFGYKHSEIVGTFDYDVLSGIETNLKVQNKAINKIRSGKGGNFELTLYHKNGTPVWVLVSLSPIIGEDGKTESITSVITDITKLKKADREIQKLSLVASESPGGVLVRDAKGVALWVNKAFELTSGYSADELVGKNLTGLFLGPDTDSKAYEQAVKLRSKGKKVSNDLLLYRKDGSSIWVQLLTYPLLNEQGKIDSMVTLSMDITDRKKKDEEYQMLSLVASKTITGVAINDKDGRVFWCNSSFEKMSGFTLDDLKGKLLGNVLKGPDTNLKELKAVRAIAGKKRSFYTELLSYKKDKSAFWVAISSTPVLDESGRLLHQVDIVDDITERKEAEAQLIKTKDEALRLSRAKEMFLSVMSHEIRTPLNTVNAITQLLLDEHPTKTQLDYLNLLKFSGENLSTLINDILDLTKMETGNLILERTRVNLHELLSNTIRSLQVKAAENSNKLILNIGDDVPVEIKGDQVRLYQILMNLVGNSIKFTKRGKITISLNLISETATTAKIAFNVIDTGIGIPDDRLETIFDAYKQAESSTSRKFGGTGLGLTITRHLVKIHGSELYVSSKVGKGSTFTFDIEFKKITNAIAPKNAQQQLSALPILVVDDNSINRMIAERVLAGLFQAIDFAENGEIALAMIRETKYACVLMDVFMPVMDGIEATTKIRTLDDPYYQELPIIALTGSTDKEDLKNIVKCGMNGYLVKPLRREDLEARLSDLIWPVHSSHAD